MADFTKLNGYDVKDAVARQQNEQLATDLENGIYNTNNYINLKRIMRELRPTSANPDYSANDYSTMQGGVYIGENKFIQASLRGSNVQLKEFNLYTGESIRTTVLQLQHANSLTYNPDTNEVYVTSLTLNNVHTHFVYVLDYTTLTIKNTLEINLEENKGTHSISYDPVSRKTYLAVETKTTNVIEFYVLNISDGSITPVELENYENMIGEGGENNDMYVYDGKMYLLKHSPSVIVKYDLKTGKCNNIFNIPLYTEFGIGIGEPESISYDPATGDIIIAGCKRDSVDGWYVMYNYFKTNLGSGINSIQRFTSTMPNNMGIYVDANSSSINPTGTSSNAFKTIGEACEMLNDQRVASLTIYVKAGEYPYLEITTPKHLTIRGYNTSPEGRASQIVHGLKFINCNNILLTALTINNLNGDYDITASLSNVMITSSTLSGNHDYHILAAQSTLKCFNLSINSGSLFRFNAEVHLISFDATPNYKIGNSAPVVNKPIKIGNFSGITNDTNGVTISYAGYEPLVETNDAVLRFVPSGYYGLGIADFVTQTTDGGNRNICVLLDSKLITVQFVFDTTAKTIKARITKAFDLKNGIIEDITSTATIGGALKYNNVCGNYGGTT